MNATENKCVCEHEYESGCACCMNECSHWWACVVCDEYFDPAEGNFVRDDIYTEYVFVCNGCES